MTGSAKQSIVPRKKNGLLRRFAPRNDDKTRMLSSTNSRHTPRMRGIQYAAASRFYY
jgi:hypothetical protein